MRRWWLAREASCTPSGDPPARKGERTSKITWIGGTHGDLLAVAKVVQDDLEAVATWAWVRVQLQRHVERHVFDLDLVVDVVVGGRDLSRRRRGEGWCQCTRCCVAAGGVVRVVGGGAGEFEVEEGRFDRCVPDVGLRSCSKGKLLPSFHFSKQQMGQAFR